MKDFLISAGFTQSTTNPAAKDYNPLTRCDCYIRVSDVHYLCWRRWAVFGNCAADLNELKSAVIKTFFRYVRYLAYWITMLIRMIFKGKKILKKN